ncbi:hypothetical protein [Gemmatimonas sp.]
MRRIAMALDGSTFAESAPSPAVIKRRCIDTTAVPLRQIAPVLRLLVPRNPT